MPSSNGVYSLPPGYLATTGSTTRRWRIYRVERGGDETCRVGRTLYVNGFPIVKGRAALRVVSRNEESK
jgi:hypothetical protein